MRKTHVELDEIVGRLFDSIHLRRCQSEKRFGCSISTNHSLDPPASMSVFTRCQKQESNEASGAHAQDGGYRYSLMGHFVVLSEWKLSQCDTGDGARL